MEPTLDPGLSSSLVADQCAAIATIAALRTGRFDATIEYGDGTSLTVCVRFDLGGDAVSPRLQTRASIRRADAARVVGESILIGERVWRRVPQGRWVAVAPSGIARVPGESVRRTVQALLPSLAGMAAPVGERRADRTVLRWHDDTINAAIALELEPVGGLPRSFRRETRSTGTVLLVRYAEWNGPVDIAPPDGLCDTVWSDIAPSVPA